MKFVGQSSPQYTFPMATRPKTPESTEMTIGIGAPKSSSPEYSFPRDSKLTSAHKINSNKDEISQGAAVGLYDIEKAFPPRQPLRGKFARAGLKKSKRSGPDIPGVGSYEVNNDSIKNRLMHGMGVSMAGRPVDLFASSGENSLSKSLGPGSYELSTEVLEKSVLKKAPAMSIPRSQKNGGISDQISGLLGPSLLLYSTEDSKPSSKIGTFTRAIRGIFSTENTKKVPGPGDYALDNFDIGNLINRKPVSIKSRRIIVNRDEDMTCWLGPGKYMVEKSSLRKGNQSFSRQQRLILRSMDERDMTPGPGDYSRSLSWNKPKSFTQAQRRTCIDPPKDSSDQPGPTDYSKYPTRKPLGGVIRHERFKPINICKSVDAIYYPEPIVKHSQACVFTTASKEHRSARQGPGVGDYNINISDKVSGVTMAKSRRVNKIIESPGPGYYDIKSTVPTIPEYEQERVRRADLMHKLLKSIKT